MNAKDLYRIIGEIDDDLILEAEKKPVKKSEKTKKVVRMWTLLSAACVCLICLSLYHLRFGTSVYWNESMGMSSFKVAISADAIWQEMSPEEAVEYYQLGEIPKTLGDHLKQMTQGSFSLYKDAGGAVVYDQNQIWYQDEAQNQFVCLTLSRVTQTSPAVEDAKVSRIQGMKVTLTKTDSGGDLPTYGAEWKMNGTTISVSGNGFSEEEFLSVLREIWKQKK